MTIDDDIAFMQRVPSLAVLGTAALRILAIGAESRSVYEGEVLFRAGERADAGYVIQRGSFVLKPAQPEGAEETIAGPGTLLGELALLTDTVRPARATARETSTVIRIPRSLFLKMLEGYPDAAQKLRDDMAARALQTARDMQTVRTKLSGDRKPT
jgi:CRP-like cAMP-binding protein